jgi:hypothetical protein
LAALGAVDSVESDAGGVAISNHVERVSIDHPHDASREVAGPGRIDQSAGRESRGKQRN